MSNRVDKKLSVRFLVSCFCILLSVETAHGEIRRVKAGASGLNNGTSWADAFNYLQDALAVASAGDQIWVARGTYQPDLGGGQTPLNRNATFQLVDDVALYGGFRGYETTLEDRVGLFDDTVLSGDLRGDDRPDFVNTDDNSYHVVTITSSEVLDGFTIRGGNAGAQNGGGRKGVRKNFLTF